MLGRSLAAGLLLGAFLVSSSALAGGVPRATLVKQADAICTADNATIVHFKHRPPAQTLYTRPTPKILKAAAGYYAEASALARSETARVFALGTPSEASARATWNDWKRVTTGTGLPDLLAMAAAMKNGDVPAFQKALTVGIAASTRGQKDRKLLGIRVCRFP